MFTRSIKKAIVVGVTALMIFGPLTAGAATTAELQAQLNALMAQLQQLQSQRAGATVGDVPNGQGETADADCVFNRNLYVGLNGTDVKCLQSYLVEEGFLKVTPTGYFGSSTKNAVARWQSAHDISASGYFGAVSRGTYASLVANKPDAPSSEDAAPPVTAGVYPTKQSCEQATGRSCQVWTCDYVPAGRTFTQVCPRGGSGWDPITGVVCTQVMKQCSDGSYVGYKYGTCEYQACPTPVQPVSPWIIVTYPRGGETFYPAGTTQISWNSANLPAGATIDIGLSDAAGQKGSSDDIASGIPNNGIYTWHIPSNQANYNRRVFISVHGTPSIYGVSAGDFTWGAMTTGGNPTISYINPTSAVAGQVVYVYGTYFDYATYVQVDGNYGTTITPTVASPTILSFSVPASLAVGQHDIQLTQKAGNGVMSASARLTVTSPITQATSPVITAPADYTTWNIGDTQSFRWNGNGPASATGYIDLVGNNVIYRVANITNSGMYQWNSVGTTSNGGIIPAGTYSFKVIINGYGDIGGPLTLVQQTAGSVIRSVGFSPSVTAGSTNQKIAQFNLYAPPNQSMTVSSITLSKSYDTGFDLQNMKVIVYGSNGEAQFGTTRATIGDSESSLTFASANPVYIPQNTSVGFAVYADVLGTTLGGVHQAATRFIGWTAVGAANGSAVPSPAVLDGPDVYVTAVTPAATGNLQVYTSSVGATNNSLVMGSTNNEVLSIRLSSDNNADLTVTDVTINDSITGGVTGVPSFQNVSLLDGSTRLAGPLAMTMSGASAGTIAFSLSSPLSIPRNSYKELRVVGDVATFSSGGSVSGSTHTFSLASGGVRAIGPNSATANISGTATGRPLTIYRTLLSISSMPPSVSTHSPSAGADDIVTVNFTVGSVYQAQLNGVRFTFTGSALAGASAFAVDLIDPNTGIALVGTTTQTCSPSGSSCSVVFNPGPSGYVIPAGATKTVKVRVNSSGFAINANSNTTLGVYIMATNDVNWSDGANMSIGLEPTIIPLNLMSTYYR